MTGLMFGSQSTQKTNNSLVSKNNMNFSTQMSCDNIFENEEDKNLDDLLIDQNNDLDDSLINQDKTLDDSLIEQNLFIDENEEIYSKKTNTSKQPFILESKTNVSQNKSNTNLKNLSRKRRLLEDCFIGSDFSANGINLAIKFFFF